MKNNKPAASKLVAKFDAQLRELLMEDLKAFKAKRQFLGANQEVAKQSLSAA
jgi:hypothetical protein